VVLNNADGDPSSGSCKKPCDTSADCPGEECIQAWLPSGGGVCGTQRFLGDSCTYWQNGDDVCHDPSLPAGATDAVMYCTNDTCGSLCNWETRVDPALDCPNGMTCPATMSPATPFTFDVAICQ